jgi:hypothetical protein
VWLPEFAPFLQQRDHRVLRVWQTNRSESKGRFNLETDHENLYPLAKTMDSDIASIYVDFLHQRSPTLPDLPSCPDQPYMASNMNVDREDTESTYTHDLSRDVPSTCCSQYSNISLSTLGSEEDDQIAHFPSLGPSNQLPSQHRSPSASTTPPVSYVTAARRGTTPSTSDLTTTPNTADLHKQIQGLVQAQQLQAEAHAKEMAELKALVIMANSSRPPSEGPTVEATHAPHREGTINSPPSIDRHYDQALDANQDHSPDPTAATNFPPPSQPQDPSPVTTLMEFVSRSEQAILKQMQEMAIQIAQLQLQIADNQTLSPILLQSHLGGIPLEAHQNSVATTSPVDPINVQHTPPSKKSKNHNITPKDVDRLKKQKCQDRSGDNSMDVDDVGEEGEIPPRPG